MNRLRGALVALPAVLAGAGIVALGGYGGALYWNRVEVKAELGIGVKAATGGSGPLFFGTRK